MLASPFPTNILSRIITSPCSYESLLIQAGRRFCGLNLSFLGSDLGVFSQRSQKTAIRAARPKPAHVSGLVSLPCVSRVGAGWQSASVLMAGWQSASSQPQPQPVLGEQPSTRCAPTWMSESLPVSVDLPSARLCWIDLS